MNPYRCWCELLDSPADEALKYITEERRHEDIKHHAWAEGRKLSPLDKEKLREEILETLDTSMCCECSRIACGPTCFREHAADRILALLEES